jgi:ADP-ribosylglycohydrolase
LVAPSWQRRVAGYRSGRAPAALILPGTRGINGWVPDSGETVGQRGRGVRNSVKRAATGTLLGLAIGDAMGSPTEFSDITRIAAEYGPWRTMPLPLSSGRARVTDDTQMTLALGEGLIEALAAGPLTAGRMEPPVRVRFLEWWCSPENNRAPGMTCLRACEALSRGGPWQAASEVGSKGCGANMRVAPAGLIPGLDQEQRSGAARLQSGTQNPLFCVPYRLRADPA